MRFVLILPASQAGSWQFFGGTIQRSNPSTLKHLRTYLSHTPTTATMKNDNSCSITVSLPDKLAHGFLTGRRDRLVDESTKSAPSVLEMPQHTIVSSTSSISREENESSPCLANDDEDGSTKGSSQFPHCVLDNATMRTYSPISTLTPVDSLRQVVKDKKSSQAIDLSLKFLSGIAPAKSADGHCTNLMPGVSYQSFTDFSSSDPSAIMLSHVAIEPKSRTNKKLTPYLSMRPEVLGLESGRLNKRAVSCPVPSDEESPIHDTLSTLSLQDECTPILESDLTIMETLPNGMPSCEIEAAPSISFLASEDCMEAATKNGNDGDDDDDDDEDVYVSFEQGEEHTLGEFEDKVASGGNVDVPQLRSTPVPETKWHRTELYDPTGLLSAMDLLLDCFDPQIKPEILLDYSPSTYDDRTLDSHYYTELDFETAMERDGMDWLFPCCDDSDLDKELRDLLEDDSTVGDAPHPNRHLYLRPRGSDSCDSISTIEKYRDSSVLDYAPSKRYVADLTMTTDGDSSFEHSD